MKQTHSFTLPSGIPCEVRRMKGKHQELLTTRKAKKDQNDGLNEVIADVVVKIGDINNLTPDMVGELLECDRKKILVETRQFSLDFPVKFDFDYDYVDAEERKASFALDIDIDGGSFPATTMKVLTKVTLEKENEDDEDKFEERLVDANFETLAELKKNLHYTVKLPCCEKVVTIGHLTAAQAALMGKYKKEDQHVNAPLKARNPSWDDNGTPQRLDVSDLDLMDIEALRKAVKDREGQVDTEVMFTHPEAHLKQHKHEQEVVLDLLSTLAFFFPSEAI